MEKLPMCRICLVEDVRMHVVVNNNLHELYEKLTEIPFVTEDRRPILACFFCYAKLKQCYQLLRKCLEAEERFARMMNEDYEPNSLINQDHLEFLGGFIKSPMVHISIEDECHTENIAFKKESIAIKEELPAVCEGLDVVMEPMEEHQSNEQEPGDLDNSCLEVADVPPHHSESDLEDDVPLMDFKTEAEEEQDIPKKRRAWETKKTHTCSSNANHENAPSGETIEIIAAPTPTLNINDSTTNFDLTFNSSQIYGLSELSDGASHHCLDFPSTDFPDDTNLSACTISNNDAEQNNDTQELPFHQPLLTSEYSCTDVLHEIITSNNFDADGFEKNLSRPPEPLDVNNDAIMSKADDDNDLVIKKYCLDGPSKVTSSSFNDTNNTQENNSDVIQMRTEKDFEDEENTDEENLEAGKVTTQEEGKSDTLKSKRIRERDFCYYCESFVLNFSRHMVRSHLAEPEVQLALSHPKKSLKRKTAFAKLRKKGNYISNSESAFKPVKKCRFSDKSDYLPCSKCLGFYSKKQLWRHVKKCNNTAPTKNAQVTAQNFLVRHVKTDKNLVEKVFPRMRPDKVSLVAKKDKLICMFGAQYLRIHREAHFATVVSRKMREMAKLLMEVTKLKPDIQSVEQMLRPQYYDTLVLATKMVARYNNDTRQFSAPTYAMNIVTSLKQCCSIVLMQSCKMEATTRTATIQADLKTLSQLITENWKFDVSSEAADDLNVKKLNKTTIVPLATDLNMFKNHLCTVAQQASANLSQSKEKSNDEAFNNLVESVYCRVLLLNRRRSGELQRLKLNEYNEHCIDTNKYEEFDKVLSPTEKVLVDTLKIIVIRGKRGRGVPVLFSSEVQNDIQQILSVRKMYIKEKNDFLFAKAGGVLVCGYKILEKYAKACGAKNDRALTSTRLRKHLATMTQVFTMNESELEQLATFMGHTLSVHRDNYRLPNDVYQTAKISKLLLLMEDGKADKFKGKSLDEIDLNLDEEITGTEIENEEVLDMELELNEDHTPQNDDLDDPETKQLPPPLQENDIHNTCAKKKRTLIPWTTEQKDVVITFFKQHIQNKKPPKRGECDELKKKYPTLLHNKDWLKIKVFIQNKYSKT